MIAGSIARTSGANVVTVNPKTLHLASGRILAGGTGKTKFMYIRIFFDIFSFT